MYSPKIREKYVPILYRLSKLKRVPMTKLVNGIIEDYLDNVEKAARELRAKEITNEMFKKRGWKIPTEKN
jgi:pyruvoyl-dependent arginine decarboxylase (PvlArgDC)